MAISSVSNSSASNATSSKGFSGLVSGMDTEALVQKLTLASKNKIIKEQQKSEKLQWKQDAYRDIIASFGAFQKSYFNTLSATNFKSPTFFNAFKASSSSGSVTATASSTATPGTTTINSITQLAERQTLSSSSSISAALSGSIAQTGTLTEFVSDLSGKSISLNLNGKVRTLTFDSTFVANAGTTVTESSLETAFQTLVTQAFGKNKSGENLVSVDFTGNKLSFASTSSKIILTGDSETLTKLGFESGQSNKISTGTSLSNLSLSSPLNGSAFDFSVNDVSFSFTGDNTLAEIISTVNSSAAGVMLSYSAVTDKLTMTSKESGSGDNIRITETQGNFAATLLNKVTEGKNAEFLLNNEFVSRSSNSFSLDGVNFNLLKVTAPADDPITVTVEDNSSDLLAPIVKFVDDYNVLIEKINTLVKEKALVDYQPLTDDQKSEMTEAQITDWEKKAKVGILASDSTLRGITNSLQSLVSGSRVKGGISLHNIGITSAGWQENGKLKIDETALKAALSTRGSEINALFTSPTGIAAKMDDIITGAIKTTGGQGSRGTLVEIAGVALHSSDKQNNIARSMALSAKAIEMLTTRLESEQTRYWAQFSAMESAISKMNTQSAMLTQQFSSSS